MKDEVENNAENGNDSRNSSAEAPAARSGGDRGCAGNGNPTVGEWTSLPVLVERLRAVVDLSLAAVNQQTDHEKTTTAKESSRTDHQQDTRMCNSVEWGVFPTLDTNLKNDLKFSEDLLLSDIQTALLHLHETLERIDIAALAKYGSASDPTNKLHLLTLVSSLISRLQLPDATAEKKCLALPSVMPQSRKRRSNRHTVGVSTEELANARRWLEEERQKQALLGTRRTDEYGLDAVASCIKTGAEKQDREICDKYTKDAINQRQSLRNRSKETHGANCGVPNQCPRTDVDTVGPNQATETFRDSSQSNSEITEKKLNYIANNTLGEHSDWKEEQSRVYNLAAALKQQTGVPASNSQCLSSNRFTKKAKIKRANTVDIPSYLKFQAQAVNQDGKGCISLRRPVDVSDRIAINNASTIVPFFEPKTENDRKFLALLNKNNEVPATNPIVPFKTFGYSKPTDLALEANKTWNSRFSNIKTTFDKRPPNEADENKVPAKIRYNSKFPLPFRESADQNITNELSARASYNQLLKVNRPAPATGFSHAASSPFRKIEKPTAPPSPTKVPTVYHWSRDNTSTAMNMVKEKAKVFFERDSNSNVQAAPASKLHKESGRKQGTAPPRWSRNVWNNTGPSDTVTENGRLDYRSFCKQFAPFLGRTVNPKCRDHQEPQQQEFVFQHNDSTSSNRHTNVVDGKISVKMLPNNYAQASQPLRNVQQVRCDKFDDSNSVYKPEVDRSKCQRSYDSDDRKPSQTNDRRTGAVATLRGSSSIGIQTGINDEHSDEARSFSVIPTTAKGQPTTYNNACVQTSSQSSSTRPLPDLQRIKQNLYYYDHHDTNRSGNPTYCLEKPRALASDYNQNDRIIADGSQLLYALPIEKQDSQVGTRQQNYSQTNTTENRVTHLGDSLGPSYQQHEKAMAQNQKSEKPQAPLHIPKIMLNSDALQETPSSATPEPPHGWSPENSNFLDDKNIENQDISTDVGVVTRYVCAIGTVASDGSPEPLSDEAGLAGSQTPSSPSPSPSSSQSWSQSRLPTNETSSEDEIRRHNLLQQSLARRLQNERTSLNDPHSLSPSSTSHTSGYSQPENFNQSPIYHDSSTSYSPNITAVTPPLKPPSVDQYPKFLSPTAPMHMDLPSQRIPSPTGYQPAPSTSSVSRIVALKEAYEQPPNCLLKPVQKERSPIPGSSGTVDSSDEYLVSCAAKQSRSIVLSKSESWHQLALSNSYPHAPRINASLGSTSSQASCLSKPPRLKSPSSQKLRTKQFEASSAADNVKKMEDKVRQYFNNPNETGESRDSSKGKRFAVRNSSRNLVGLSRSRTMLGISDEKLRVTMPTTQVSLLNVNTADVDKVFDDLFKEATDTNNRQY